MYLAGFGCILLGGCPLRQLILAGEGNTDSAVTVLGLMAGAAFAHNFGLASSGEGPTANGKNRSYYWNRCSCSNCGSELHEKRRSLIVGMQTSFPQSIRSLCGKYFFRIISGNPRQFNYRDESANCAYLHS